MQSQEVLPTRVDLAACYRLVDHFGMSDMIFTHITSKSPGHRDAFLINRYGQLFSEVHASDLLEVDCDGAVLSGVGPVNQAGFLLHAAIHRARQDAYCVIHTHSIAGMVVSACKAGLLPVCQHAMKFYNRIACHPYDGIVLDRNDGELLVSALGNRQALILHNHGLLAVGRTVPEAFHVMYHLEIACRVQMRLLPILPDVLLPLPEIAERVALQFESFPQPLGRREWPALLRLLDRVAPGYRE